MADPFDLESNVRGYSRSFPATFTTARGSRLYDSTGRSWIDFLAGAGALNYGHNHPRLKAALTEHIANDGITHGLDLRTGAKERFLVSLRDLVLQPRQLDYLVQFTGPTGTNAVEAALKLARKATGRRAVFAFMGGYHGHSLGALAVTSNREHRAAAGTGLGDVTFLPYPDGPLANVDTLAYLRAVLDDTHSGVELPAAVIVETIQAEGGVMVAPDEWLRELASTCRERGIVLIVDDIQTGAGRTGPYFSFERSGIVPDLVTLSKSLSGYGLPMAVVLIRPDLDVWEPAEHTGTFRGHQLAFVTAAESFSLFHDEDLEGRTTARGRHLGPRLREICAAVDSRLAVRGAGMMWGIDSSALDPTGALAAAAGRHAFDNGLVIERVGRHDTVLKLLAPLTIEDQEMDEGLEILGRSLSAMGDSGPLDRSTAP